jgi:hypothetical protein
VQNTALGGIEAIDVKIRDVLTKRVTFEDIFHTGQPSQRRLRFFTLRGARSNAQLIGEECAVLVPFRTLVAYPFSFPFGRKGRVRDALALNFRPVIGEKENELSLVPQIIEQRTNETNGIAWFASKKEIEDWEGEFGSGTVFWPEPYAFAGEVNGTGSVICASGSGCSGMLFRDGAPVIYRWLAKEDGDAEMLIEWLRKYSESKGIKNTAEKIIDVDSLVNVQQYGDFVTATYPGLGALDLSNRAADTAEQMEQFISLGFKISKMLTVLGAVFLVLSLVLLIQNKMKSDSFAAAPPQIYKSAFGENSNSPLSSAYRKLRLLTGTGAQMAFDQTLGNISAAWSAMPAGTQVKLDALRYGAERTEIQGLASSTGDIDKLRDALAANGFKAKNGDVQQVPGSGLRFTITLNETAGVKE